MKQTKQTTNDRWQGVTQWSGSIFCTVLLMILAASYSKSYGQGEISGETDGTTKEIFVVNSNSTENTDAALRLLSRGSRYVDWLIHNENGNGRLYFSISAGYGHDPSFLNDIGTRVLWMSEFGDAGLPDGNLHVENGNLYAENGFITDQLVAARMDVQGHVGIGYSTPVAEKLEVNGNVKVGKLGIYKDRYYNGTAWVNEPNSAGIDIDGAGKLSITDNVYFTGGNVGFGTTNPDKGKVHVVGSLHVENSEGHQTFHVSSGKQLVFVGDSAYIQYQASLAQPADSSNVIQSGEFSLWVSKGIVSEDFAIENADDWADFVFKDDYDLLPIAELEAYIQKNGHLPEMPSEAEVKKRGYSLHDINKKLLQKIEELTLYTIEQEKRLKAQDARYEDLATRLSNLEHREGQ